MKKTTNTATAKATEVKKNNRLTEEQRKAREQEKAERAEQKRIVYENGHFFLEWTDENGKTHKDVLNGYITELAVVFCTDPLNYTVVCDDKTNGLFIRPYVRTKDNSVKYDRMARYAKDVREDSLKDTQTAIGNITTYSALRAKALNCKAFKETKIARVHEVVGIAVAKAETQHAKAIRRAEKKIENVA